MSGTKARAIIRFENDTYFAGFRDFVDDPEVTVIRYRVMQGFVDAMVDGPEDIVLPLRFVAERDFRGRAIKIENFSDDIRA